MEWEEHKRQVDNFLNDYEPDLVGNLSEALYTVNELGLWPDDVTVSMKQALFCWNIVEKMRTHEFPDELRM